MSARETDPLRGQHHGRLALLTAAGLVIAALAGLSSSVWPEAGLWHAIAAPDEDGNWRFVSINGRDVRDAGYGVTIRWGEPVGWDNGCNDCGMVDVDDPSQGMVCTLQACAEQPFDHLYRRFPGKKPAIELRGDTLILSVYGHRAILIRD